MLVVVARDFVLQVAHAVRHPDPQPRPQDAEQATVAAKEDHADENVETADILINEQFDFFREWAVVVDLDADNEYHVARFVA